MQCQETPMRQLHRDNHIYNTIKDSYERCMGAGVGSKEYKLCRGCSSVSSVSFSHSAYEKSEGKMAELMFTVYEGRKLF
jgi:hypothetical protein